MRVTERARALPVGSNENHRFTRILVSVNRMEIPRPPYRVLATQNVGSTGLALRRPVRGRLRGG